MLDLSRNFGHQIAITAGIDHAHGDAVVVMDTDLQDPPAVAIGHWSRPGRAAPTPSTPSGGPEGLTFKRFSAWLYYALLHVFAEVDVRATPATAG